MPICDQCRTAKAVTDFALDRRCVEGRRPTCFSCEDARPKRKRNATRDEKECPKCRKRLSLQLFAKGHGAGGRQGYCRRCTAILKRTRYKLTPQEKIAKQDALYAARIEDQARHLFVCARGRAKARQIPFTITPADVIIPAICPVLGVPLRPTVRGAKRQDMFCPTLDRVNNLLGYVPGNVCVISWRANSLKSDASLEELRALVHYMETKKE